MTPSNFRHNQQRHPCFLQFSTLCFKQFQHLGFKQTAAKTETARHYRMGNDICLQQPVSLLHVLNAGQVLQRQFHTSTWDANKTGSVPSHKIHCHVNCRILHCTIPPPPHKENCFTTYLRQYVNVSEVGHLRQYVNVSEVGVFNNKIWVYG